MRFAPYVLATLLAGTVAGCAQPYYQSYGYGYGPQYAYASPPAYYSASPAYYSAPPASYSASPAYYSAPPASYSAYAYSAPADRYPYTSRWDYYRNYQGSFHPGPER